MEGPEGKLTVAGLVPARGGSRGVPRKNVRKVAGVPLLAHTARAARDSSRLWRVFLSTEDEEIADVGRQYGLEVPFLRPKELAGDASTSYDVVAHFMGWLAREGHSVDAICLLEPTNPLRRSVTIDQAISMLEGTDADSVVSVVAIPNKFNPHWVYWRNSQGELRISTGEREPISRRQDLPSAYIRDGSVYLTRTEVIRKKKSLYGDRVLGLEVDLEESINIDTIEDLTEAERRIKGRTALKESE